MNTIAILQVEATIHGFGSLKPFLENVLNDMARRAIKNKPKLYSRLVETKTTDLRKRLNKKN